MPNGFGAGHATDARTGAALRQAEVQIPSRRSTLFDSRPGFDGRNPFARSRADFFAGATLSQRQPQICVTGAPLLQCWDAVFANLTGTDAQTFTCRKRGRRCAFARSSADFVQHFPRKVEHGASDRRNEKIPR